MHHEASEGDEVEAGEGAGRAIFGQPPEARGPDEGTFDDPTAAESQRVDRGMQLGALLALGEIPAGTMAALGRGLQGAAVEDGDSGPAFAAGEVAQEQAQIVHHRLEDTGLEPAPGLLVDDVPGWEIMRQPASGRAGLHEPLERVEHLAKEQRP